MKHFAKDMSILYKAVGLYSEEKKREKPGAEGLLHSLGNMFAEESDTVVSVWVNYNNNPMTFPKDAEGNEEYRGELRDIVEEAQSKEGFTGTEKDIYFLKTKIDADTSYGVAVRFPKKIKEDVKREIAAAAQTVFCLPKTVFERDDIREKHNPLGLPELTYYKDKLRNYDGAAFLRPKGFVEMASGMPDKDGLDPLMSLYKEYIEVIMDCRELQGACDFAFDSWALVVLTKRGRSGLLYLNNLVTELTELGIGEPYEVQKNIFSCGTAGYVMKLSNLLMVSMKMNESSIEQGVKVYVSSSGLAEMRDKRVSEAESKKADEPQKEQDAEQDKKDGGTEENCDATAGNESGESTGVNNSEGDNGTPPEEGDPAESPAAKEETSDSSGMDAYTLYNNMFN